MTVAVFDLLSYENQAALNTSYEVYKRCVRSNPNVFPLATGLAYDRRKALFSIEKLKLNNGIFEVSCT